MRLCERLAVKLNAWRPDLGQVPIRTIIRRLVQAIAEGEASLDDIREALDYLEPRH